MLKFPKLPWKKEKNTLPREGDMQIDEVTIDIEGVTLNLSRKLSLQDPHEVTAVIPRAELRKKWYENGELAYEEEMLLNSITIVHSPLRTPIEETKKYSARHSTC